jgi:hypothetical protein
VEQGQIYSWTYYVQNLGSEAVYLSYKPYYYTASEEQVRIYLTLHVFEKGLPCQLYSLSPPVELPEKDPLICDQGFYLTPGKMVKILVTLWVESVESGGTITWDLVTYGCAT